MKLFGQGVERRQSFIIDREKFATQRAITYYLLALFAAMTFFVFLDDDKAERANIMQTIVNLTLLAVGYWIGSSKGSTDKDASISRIAEASAPTAAAAVAAASAAAPAGTPPSINAEEVKIEAQNVTTTEQPPKGNP